MEIVSLALSESPALSYDIFIGESISEQVFKRLDISRYSRVILLSDTNTHNYAEQLTAAIQRPAHHITVPPGEAHKDIQTLSTIWSQMAEYGADRKSLLLCVGGGVIGDIGGFAASAYMRGVDFIQVPTTLLAMVDASVGGKTAIDHAGIKNIVGSFQQPKAVIIDLHYLRSLPIREYRSGFAEILKHGLIADPTYLSRVQDHLIARSADDPHAFDARYLQEMIRTSVQIKKRIVESDPTEKGRRKMLNFGHTVGHAVEALSHEHGQPLLHGEAIAIGMCVELALCAHIGFVTTNIQKSLQHTLTQLQLPTRIPVSMTRDALLKKMQSDKKNANGSIRYVLLRALGDAVADQMVPDDAVKSVVSSFV